MCYFTTEMWCDCSGSRECRKCSCTLRTEKTMGNQVDIVFCCFRYSVLAAVLLERIVVAYVVLPCLVIISPRVDHIFDGPSSLPFCNFCILFPSMICDCEPHFNLCTAPLFLLNNWHITNSGWCWWCCLTLKVVYNIDMLAYFVCFAANY